jgi:polar amino acid transport system substrate-binding protein
MSSQVVPSFPLMFTDYYIAFSKNTPANVISQWQQALDELKADGTYGEVYRKWFN